MKIPYTQKEIKLMRSLKRRHGAKKGNQIYHAMLNSKEHEENFGARSKRERTASARESGKARKRAKAKPKKHKKSRGRKARRRTKKRGYK